MAHSSTAQDPVDSAPMDEYVDSPIESPALPEKPLENSLGLLGIPTPEQLRFDKLLSEFILKTGKPVVWAMLYRHGQSIKLHHLFALVAGEGGAAQVSISILLVDVER